MSKLELQNEAQNLLLQGPVFLHCNASGNHPRAQVVELAVLDTGGQPLVDELVRPLAHIRPDASQVHGITDELVRSAPEWIEVWQNVYQIIYNRRLILYDVPGELGLLRYSCQQARLRWSIDESTVVNLGHLCARHLGEWDSRLENYRIYPLVEAAARLGLEVEVISHRRAREDAWLARAILLTIAGWKVV